MRIAISGTHFMGKSTLIEDFINKHPDYQSEIEPYYQLLEEATMESEPSLESLLEQLDFSIEQLNSHANEPNIIFDRCPLDFIAYAMCEMDQNSIDIDDSEISERFPEIKAALNNLDLIVFLPITTEHIIEYTEENPIYRKLADKCFKKIYRDDIYDIFPSNDHPKIIEIWGSPLALIKKLEHYL